MLDLSAITFCLHKAKKKKIAVEMSKGKTFTLHPVKVLTAAKSFAFLILESAFVLTILLNLWSEHVRLSERGVAGVVYADWLIYF